MKNKEGWLYKEKAMKKVGILLIVLVMCLPACGYVLVYKLTMNGTAASFENNEPNGWIMAKDSANGYLVMLVDKTDPNTVNTAQYVDCYTSKNELGKSQKFYSIWNAGESFQQIVLAGQDAPKTKNITALNVDLVGEQSGYVYELTGFVLGTNSLADIGLIDDEKADISISLKGSTEFISGQNLGELDETVDGRGPGSLALALDSKWTKMANKVFEGNIDAFLAVDPNTPQGLIEWLIKSSYASEE